MDRFHDLPTQVRRRFDRTVVGRLTPRNDLAAALEAIAAALSRHDRDRAVQALDRIDGIDSHSYDALALARDVATGAVRVLGTEKPSPPEASSALFALAEGLRAVEPQPEREAVERARSAARAARAADDALGSA